MLKTEQLNSLFLKWKEYKPLYKTSFSEDGIINEELWIKADIKIMFLLKETNNYIGDFREYVNKGPWKAIGYWGHGLQNIADFSYPDFAEARKENSYKYFCRSSAIVNLKKAPGGSSSNMNSIQEAAFSDREFIEEELRIISPKIIVCGGTFDICTKLWGKYEMISERVHKTAVFKDVVWIDFLHPRARIGQEFLYYALLHIFQKYLNNKNG